MEMKKDTHINGMNGKQINTKKIQKIQKMQEDQKKKNSWKYMTGLNNHGDQLIQIGCYKYKKCKKK